MGRVSVWCCAAVGLTGCAQLFGIDNTSSAPDVALPPLATLTIERVSIGATTETSPQDLTGQTAAYYIADDVETSGLRRIAATASGNVWTADVPDGIPASVEYTLPDAPGMKRLLAFPNRDLKAPLNVFEHLNLEPAPVGGMFNVSVTLDSGYTSSNELLRLYAIGPWTYHNLTPEVPVPDMGNMMIGPVDIAYDDDHFPHAITMRPTPKVTSADRIVALRYVGPTLVSSGEVAQFTQSGITDVVTSTLVANTPVAQDVDVEPMGLASRLTMTTPAAPTGPLIDWMVSAAPGADHGNEFGIQLAVGPVTATDPMMTVTTGVGNPFTAFSWPSVFQLRASYSRLFTDPNFPSPLSITLLSVLEQHLLDVPGAKVDMPAPLPVLVLVNTTPLTSDGLTVTIDPNKAVKLSMVADRTGADVYVFLIRELVPAANSLDPISVYEATGPSTEITIPAGTLQTGKRYTIRAHCYKGGFPMASAGDLATRDLPRSVGYLDSGVFTVAAP